MLPEDTSSFGLIYGISGVMVGGAAGKVVISTKEALLLRA